MKKIRGFVDGMRRDVVGQIDDRRLGIDREDHPLHAGYEIVSVPEIRE
jgi:hypothetical protein